ncbi:unnamed protein product [Amoebophrya sp. A120]|nr:unnamed protein product [Amoebophrya sp. A120]|eukprot:GSA120T00011927001.1
MVQRGFSRAHGSLRGGVDIVDRATCSRVAKASFSTCAPSLGASAQLQLPHQQPTRTLSQPRGAQELSRASAVPVTDHLSCRKSPSVAQLLNRQTSVANLSARTAAIEKHLTQQDVELSFVDVLDLLSVKQNLSAAAVAAGGERIVRMFATTRNENAIAYTSFEKTTPSQIKEVPTRLLARAVMTLARCDQKLSKSTPRRNGKTDVQQLELAKAHLSNAVKEIQEQLKPKLVNEFARSDLSPKDLANTLWGFARMQIQLSRTELAALADCFLRLRNPKPIDLSNVLWSLSKLVARSESEIGMGGCGVGMRSKGGTSIEEASTATAFMACAIPPGQARPNVVAVASTGPAQELAASSVIDGAAGMSSQLVDDLYKNQKQLSYVWAFEPEQRTLWTTEAVRLLEQMDVSEFTICESVMLLSAFNDFLAASCTTSAHTINIISRTKIHEEVFRRFAKELKPERALAREVGQLVAAFTHPAAPQTVAMEMVLPPLLAHVFRSNFVPDRRATLASPSNPGATTLGPPAYDPHTPSTDRFCVQDVTSLFYSLAKLPNNFLQKYEHVFVQKGFVDFLLEHGDSRGIALSLWSFALADCRFAAFEMVGGPRAGTESGTRTGEPSQFTCDSVWSRIDDAVHVSNIFHSLAVLRLRPEKVLNHLAQKILDFDQNPTSRLSVAQTTKSTIKPNQIGSIVWACAQLGYDFNGMMNDFDGKMKELQEKEATLDEHQNKTIYQLLHRLADRFSSDWHIFDARQQCNALWAFAQLGFDLLPKVLAGALNSSRNSFVFQHHWEPQWKSQLYIVWLTRRTSMLAPLGVGRNITASTTTRNTHYAPSIVSSPTPAAVPGGEVNKNMTSNFTCPLTPHWRELRDAYLACGKDVSSSDIAARCAAALKTAVAEYEVAGSGVIVDIAVPETKTAIEVDGEWSHYVRVFEGNEERDATNTNSCTNNAEDPRSGAAAKGTKEKPFDVSTLPMVTNGKTRTKRKLVEKLGWRCIDVRTSDIEKHRDEASLRAFLQRLIAAEEP